MTILQKLHKIEEKKVIYDIHYCKAGVGIVFYEPPKGYDVNTKFNDSLHKDYWRKYLTVEKYYPTFEKAITAEFNMLPLEPKGEK